MSVWNMFGGPVTYGGGSSNPGWGSGTTTKFTPNAPINDPNAPLPYEVLAKKLNDFMAQQAKNQYTANLPDYDSLVGQRSKNTGAQLRGEVPQDVINQLLQSGAERGIATGSPGGPNANAAYLRALGLTSIGQQEAGSKNLTQSIADTPVSPLFNPASLIVPDILGQAGLQAARSGLNRYGGLPYNTGNSGYHAPAMPEPSRWGSAAGATGWGGGAGGTPAVGAGAKGWTPQANPFEDNSFRYGLENDESNMDWSNYSPFGTQPGPSDFSDWFE